MAETAFDVFEAAVGISGDEMIGSDGRVTQAAADQMARLDKRTARDQIDAFYAGLNRPAYASHELVPRVWRTEDGYVHAYTGDDHVRAGGKPRDIATALLYCHRVETSDPLLASLESCVRLDDWADEDLFVAVKWWLTLRPLIDSGLVVPVRGDLNPYSLATWRTLTGLLTEQLHTASMRRLLIEIMLPYQAADVALPLDGRPDDNLLRAAVTAQLSDIDAPLGDYLEDLGRLTRASAESYADLWCPTRTHLRLLGELFSQPPVHDALAVDPVLVNLADVRVADFGDLSTRELIAIRRHSDAFEGWRDAVRQVLRTLDRQVGAGVELAAARQEAQDHLHGTGVELLDRLGREKAKPWSGAARGFVIGMVGAAPGALLRPGAGLTMPLAGGLAGFVGNVIWGRAEARHIRLANDAVGRHIAVLCDRLQTP